MPRRFVLIAIILVFALCIIIGFFSIRKKSSTGGNPLKAIPVDAALVLRINNIHSLTNSLTTKNKIWTNLDKLPVIAKISSRLLQIDSLIKNNSDFAEIALKSTVYISGHYIGGRRVEYLFVVSLPPGMIETTIINFLDKLTRQKLQETNRKYESKNIYTLKLGSENENYYLSVSEGNVLWSKSVIMVENSIRQMSLSKSMLEENGFAQIMATAGKNKDANLFIDLRRFTSIASTLATDKFAANLKHFNHFGSWSELDINPTENQLILNGFLFSDAAETNFVNLFKELEPVEITVDKILPVYTTAFITLGISDMKVFLAALEKYRTEIGKADESHKKLKDLDNAYTIDFSKLFTSIIDNEITIAEGTIDEATHKQSRFVIIKCKSGTQTKKQLSELLRDICKKKGIQIQQQQFTYSIDNETKFDIECFPIDNLTGKVYGDLLAIEGPSYYTFLGNYLIFGESKESLGSFIYSNILNTTLANNQVYTKFRDNIANRSLLLFYTNLSRSSLTFDNYLHKDVIKSWEAHFDLFQKIQPLGVQITKVSNMPYANVLIQFVEEYSGKPQTVWESLLDTSFTFKPQLVVNHYTKQNEIFLQDNSNTIYLINKAGRILWKQKIAEQINSQVYQIDFFKNGKLQILFSSANYIHLIDREGNYVDRYPVRLRSQASTGMALFDYEQNKDYRIFIPGTDSKVYAYTMDGKLISGWQFSGSDYPALQPINHFQVGDKDYIVLGDKNHIYILDRRGTIRVPVSEVISQSKNNNYILDEHGAGEKSRLVITDTTGTIISVYFDGHVTHTNFGAFTSDHYFDFKDVDADGEKDYIFLDNNKLQVFKQNKSLIYSYEFENIMKQRPVYFKFSATDRKLGLVDTDKQFIYLMNNNGTLYKDFPLIGNTLFSIGNLDASEGTFNLIVGGKNNFLYNYSVQ